MMPHENGRGALQITVGIILIICVASAAIFAPYLASHDPLHTDAGNWLRPPGGGHPFGTDRLGRDIFSRVLYGTRVSLSVGLFAMFLSVSIGTAAGALAGYYGGIVDMFIMRITDLVMVFPSLFLVLSLVAIFDPALWLVVAVIGFTGWPGLARLVRGEMLRLREADFTASAQLVGASTPRIIIVHLLPNALGPLLISATLFVPAAIMTEAGLGYFGLGIQPPVPTLGNMLRDAQFYMRHAWWYAAFPGLFIFISVFAFHLLGEGLRCRFDVRSARRSTHA